MCCSFGRNSMLMTLCTTRNWIKWIATTLKSKSAVLIQSSPLSPYQLLMASRLLKLLYVLHQQIVGLCICCEYFTYPKNDFGLWHLSNISSVFATFAKLSLDEALRTTKRPKNLNHFSLFLFTKKWLKQS